jgi:glycine oxidase ThiO
MGSRADILVIGGGVIGLATSIQLAQQGAKVAILSRDFAQSALQSAAGMLAPQAENLPAGPMLDLCLRSRSLYPKWIADLEAQTGLEAGYWDCGILAPVSSPAQYPDFKEVNLTAGPRLWLDRGALQQRQPGLSPQIPGAWWFPADAQVDNRALAQVLQAAAQQLGIAIHSQVTVQGWQYQAGRVAAVDTSAGEWQADTYILAAGAWSGSVLPIPVLPRKGQMLAVQAPGPEEKQPLRQVIFGEGIYLVPRRNGRIVIGATNERVGFTPGNTPLGLRSLLEGAMDLYPPLADWPIQETWWGFRPCTPDELPILGFSPYPNLVLATGHYRNGILLAPITAHLISDLILHQRLDPLLEGLGCSRLSCDWGGGKILLRQS